MTAVVLLAVSACSQADVKRSPITVRDSAGVAIIEHDLELLPTICTVDSQPSITIGGQETEEQQLYRVFGATRLSDGRIALTNQDEQLRFYAQDGRFLQQVGRKGEGPGEFRDAFYLWVLPGDTIWVGDYSPFQFQIFAPNGEFVRTVRPSPEYNLPTSFSVLSDGGIVIGDDGWAMWRATPDFQMRSLTVVMHDRNGLLTDTIGTYPNGRWGKVREDLNNSIYALFESFAHFAASGSRLLIAHGSKPELLIYNATGELRLDRIIRWSTDSRDVTADDVEAEQRRVAALYPDLDPGTRRDLVSAQLSKDRPVADKFPAFGRVMIGRDGRFWVRGYRRPTAPRPYRWIVFDSAGEFQCHATTPPFAELLEFGSDYLLALDRDSLDVERVFQYSVGPASNNGESR